MTSTLTSLPTNDAATQDRVQSLIQRMEQCLRDESIEAKGLVREALELLKHVGAKAAEVAGMVDALQFYATGSHFVMANPDEWESVSGEPQNFMEHESNVATVEDGSVAASCLEAAGIAVKSLQEEELEQKAA